MTIYFNGRPIEALEGEPIASALMNAGIRAFRTTARRHEPRGIFCAIGRCTDCMMIVDGVPNTRTCVTPGVRRHACAHAGGAEYVRKGGGEKKKIETDVAVVGAGLAGLSAAGQAAAAGEKENYMAFPGSTLPGVMGAGAAQTMANVNRVLPDERILMLGSGNVGLIVSYQLMQAGAEVVALVEGAPKIGGYGVHAGKIRRAGVPIYTAHSIKRVFGKDKVEGVKIV